MKRLSILIIALIAQVFLSSLFGANIIADAGDTFNLRQLSFGEQAAGGKAALTEFGAVKPGALYLLDAKGRECATNNMGLPVGKKVLVIESSDGSARVPGFSGVLLKRFRELGNTVQIVSTKGAKGEQLREATENMRKNLARLRAEGFDPDVILLPHPSSVEERDQAARIIAVNAITTAYPDKNDIIEVSYSTPSMGRYDLHFYFGGDDVVVVDKALEAFITQMPRTPFDKSTIFMEQASALAQPYGAGYDRMEKFVVRKFVNGRLERLDLGDGRFSGVNLPAILQNAIVYGFGPHNDDMVILAGGLLMTMARPQFNNVVYDVFANNSNRAAFPENLLADWYGRCEKAYGLTQGDVMKLMAQKDWTADKFGATGIALPKAFMTWNEFAYDFQRKWLAWQTTMKIKETRKADEIIGVNPGILTLTSAQLEQAIDENQATMPWLTLCRGIPGLPHYGVHESSQNKDKNGDRIVLKQEKEAIRNKVMAGLEETLGSGKKTYIAFLPLSRDPDLWGIEGQETAMTTKDAHPDHRAMYDAFMEAIEMLSKESRYQNIDIVVFFGAAPWAGTANAFCYFNEGDYSAAMGEYAASISSADTAQGGIDTAKNMALGLAIPGRELLSSFGILPPPSAAFGGEYAERVNIQVLRLGRVPKPQPPLADI